MSWRLLLYLIAVGLWLVRLQLRDGQNRLRPRRPRARRRGVGKRRFLGRRSGADGARRAVHSGEQVPVDLDRALHYAQPAVRNAKWWDRPEAELVLATVYGRQAATPTPSFGIGVLPKWVIHRHRWHLPRSTSMAEAAGENAVEAIRRRPIVGLLPPPRPIDAPRERATRGRSWSWRSCMPRATASRPTRRRLSVGSARRRAGQSLGRSSSWPSYTPGVRTAPPSRRRRIVGSARRRWRFEAAAERGNSGRSWIWPKLYPEGRGVEADPQEAARWYQAAAEQGNPGRSWSSRSCMLRGTASRPTRRRRSVGSARRRRRSEARPRATIPGRSWSWRSCMPRVGGRARDPAGGGALVCARRAEQGNPWAQFELAKLYAKARASRPTRRRRRAGIRPRPSRTSGAQLGSRSCTLRGYGVEAAPQEADRWFGAAAVALRGPAEGGDSLGAARAGQALCRGSWRRGRPAGG